MLSGRSGQDGRWRSGCGTWRLAGLAVAAVALPVVGLAAIGAVGGDRLAMGLTLSAGWAPLVAVVIGVACGLALLPTHLTSLACGYLLGLAVGLPTAMAGVVAASLVGYWLAGRLEPTALRAMAERRAVGRALVGAMLDRGPGRAVAAVTLARLPPQVPFALGNVLAASLGVGWRPLVIGTAAGMLPRVAMVVWLGSELAAWDPSAAPPRSLLISAVSAVLGLGGLAVWTAAILRRSAAAGGDSGVARA